MLDKTTEKNLKRMVKPAQANARFYKKIMDNCTQYLVKPSGDKFWLCNNWIVAEWFDCQHINPFESWKFQNNKQATEIFNEGII